MKTRQFIVSTFVLIIASVVLFMPGETQAGGGVSFAAPAPDHTRIEADLESTPLMFVENVGQFSDSARFQVASREGTLWLAENGLWVTVLKSRDKETQEGSNIEILSASSPHSIPTLPHYGVNLKLSFVGANAHPHLEPFNRRNIPISYLIGNDSAKWRADVPVWGGVRYVNLYPDIDLEVSSEAGHWTWRLVNRNPSSAFHISDIRLRVDGANTLALDSDRLRLATSVGEFTLPLLQVIGCAETSLAHPTIIGNQVFSPFSASIYNLLSATTSPQSGASDLIYSTFLGGSKSNYGSSYDESSSIAVDATGAVYITGNTNSSDFPITPGTFQTVLHGTSDAFVMKLNATGSGLAYATFLGGEYDEEGYDIAIDGNGAAYITGRTNSPNFPTTPGAFDTTYNSNTDAFVVKLNSTGSALAYATFLGGGDTEFGNGIAVDGNGRAHVIGLTHSSNFPTTSGAFDRTCGMDGNCNADNTPFGHDVFVVKLNATGSGLTYATFLGGDYYDLGYDIAVDGTGAAYVTGSTQSSDFPTTPGAFDRICGIDGNCNYKHRDVFVARLNPLGSALTYATFLGGGPDDIGYGIAVDRNGAAYITGETNSSDFPTTPGAFDTTYSRGADAFVVKLNAAGSALAYATFLGEGANDYGNSIVVDRNGAACVTGRTNSPNFPSTPDAFDPSFNGNSQLLCTDGTICPDAFVVKLNHMGSMLSYGTFLGGLPDEWGEGIAIDGSGMVYVTGSTHSSDFPTTPGAFDTSFNDSFDVFVTKLLPVSTSTGYKIYLPVILCN